MDFYADICLNRITLLFPLVARTPDTSGFLADLRLRQRKKCPLGALSLYYMIWAEGFWLRQSFLARYSLVLNYKLCLFRSSREPPTLRAFLQTSACANEKRIGGGIRAFSGAPRQTIINRLFCLTGFSLFKARKAKCSLSFAAPTLESLAVRNTKKDRGWYFQPLSFWRRRRDSNPRGLSPKRFSRPPRYDRFDTPAYSYIIPKYHSVVNAFFGLTEKNKCSILFL